MHSTTKRSPMQAGTCLKSTVAVLIALVVALPVFAFGVPVASGASEVQVLPTRSISIRGTNVDRRVYVVGKVGGVWRNKWVGIQRRDCPTCSFRKYRGDKTNAQSRYRVRVYVPPGGRRISYRAVVRASSGYAKSYSRVLKLWWSSS